MSFYRSNQTQFKNKQCLAKALKKHFNNVEVHETPQQIQGYHNAQSQRGAEVIVRRKDHKGHYDIGFQKQADGTFAALIADDETHLGKKFMSRLAVDYAEEQTNVTAGEQNCELESREVLGNGAVKLRYVVNGGY